MASDSGTRTPDEPDDDDSVSDDAESTGGGVVTLDYEDGKLIDAATGKEVNDPPPDPGDHLPDWLWAQHNSPPPQEPEE